MVLHKRADGVIDGDNWDEMIDAITIREGATAYVGFDSNKKGAFTNYFVCDGIADDVQINAAIAYVDALDGRGSICIENGNYDITADITIDDRKNVYGMGMRATNLVRSVDDVNIILQSGVAWTESIMLRDLTLDGNDLDGTVLSILSPRSVKITRIGILNSNDIGVEIGATSYSVIIDNCNIGTCDIGVQFAGNHNILSNSRITGCDTTNVNIISSARSVIIENCTIEKVQDAGTYNLEIVGGSKEAYAAHLITGCSFEDGSVGGGNIRISTPTTNPIRGVKIHDCWFTEDEKDIYIEDAEETDIRGNYFTGAGTAITLTATAVGTRIFGNDFDCGTALVDNGTDTKLATVKGDFPVSNIGGGTAAVAPVINTSPGGVDIDANDEFCYVHVPLPEEVQQVVRFKLWAYTNVLEADKMRLRIVSHGATDNEAWSGNAVDVPDHPSESSNFAAGDVVYWLVDATDDAQIGTLAAQDLVELMAVGEAAGGADCATDALFGGYEIEYV